MRASASTITLTVASDTTMNDDVDDSPVASISDERAERHERREQQPEDLRPVHPGRSPGAGRQLGDRRQRRRHREHTGPTISDAAMTPPGTSRPSYAAQPTSACAAPEQQEAERHRQEHGVGAFVAMGTCANVRSASSPSKQRGGSSIHDCSGQRQSASLEVRPGDGQPHERGQRDRRR